MQYPRSRFNSILKNRYDTWVAQGKNDIPVEELDAIFDDVNQQPTQPKAFQYRIQRLLQLILLKKLLITVIKIIF